MTGIQRIHREKLLGFVSPALFILTAVVLMNYVDENPNFTADMVEGGFGPTAWPSYMLYGVMFFAGGWLMQELLAFWRAHSGSVWMERGRTPE